MAFNLEEQEQIANLRDSWKKYGNAVITLLFIVALGVLGYKGWNFYNLRQSDQAAALYDQLSPLLVVRDGARTSRIAEDLREKYARSAYAALGSLAQARLAFDLNDLNGAKSSLQWVIDRSGNPDYQAIARIQLAGVQLDQKDYAAALAALEGKIPDAFQGAMLDRRGDVLLAQNKLSEAREAYRQALEKMQENEPGKALIQHKLDAVGVTPAA